MERAPSANADVVQVAAPPEAVMASQPAMSTPPSLNVTLPVGAGVPARVADNVTDWFRVAGLAPEERLTTGATFTLKVTVAEVELAFPRVSTCMADSVWLPRPSVEAQLHVPAAPAVAVQTVADPSFTVTVAPFSAPLPETVGLRPTVELAIGAPIAGASAMVSLFAELLALALLPAGSLTDAPRVTDPSARALTSRPATAKR